MLSNNDPFHLFRVIKYSNKSLINIPVQVTPRVVVQVLVHINPCAGFAAGLFK